MKRLLLLLALQTSAACATLHRAPDERREEEPVPLYGSGGVAGATALGWYTATVEAQPIDPQRPTYNQVTVKGTTTTSRITVTSTANANVFSIPNVFNVNPVTGQVEIAASNGYLYFSNASASTGVITSNISAANAGATPATSMVKIYPQNALDAADYVFNVGNAANSSSLFNVAYNGAASLVGPISLSGANDIKTATGGALQLHSTTNRHYFLSDGTNLLGGVPGTAVAGTNFGIGGTLNVTTADVTSSGASNLISYTLPANALVVTNRCLRITGWGTALNNANAKTVALDFGSQTVITKILTPSIANTTWKVQAIVCRSGSNTQDIYAEAWNPMGTTVSSVDANTVLYQAARTAGTQTETASITIKGKTTTATTTDVTMDGLTVEYL